MKKTYLCLRITPHHTTLLITTMSQKAIFTSLCLILSVFSLKAATPYTVATEQGIKNDGSPIGKELNELVKANYGGSIYFPAGVYNITEPIVTPFDYDKNVNLVFDKNATVTTDAPLEALVMVGFSEFNDTSVEKRDLRRFSYIEGGHFDAKKAKRGIWVNGLKQLVSLRELSVYYCKGRHIEISCTDHFRGTGSADTKISQVSIQGESSNEDNYGIYIGARCGDCKISDTFIYGTGTGVYTEGAGHIVNNLHILSWRVGDGKPGDFSKSVGIRIARQGFYIFNEVYFDTTAYDFVIDGDIEVQMIADKCITHSWVPDLGKSFISTRNRIRKDGLQAKVTSCIFNLDYKPQDYRIFDIPAELIGNKSAITFSDNVIRSSDKLYSDEARILGIRDGGEALVQSGGFEKTMGGEDVRLYRLHSGKMTMQVTNYGGRVVSLFVPDKDGNPVDVVLGHSSLDGYLQGQERFLGSVVGPVANRIVGASYKKNGRRYRLEANHNGKGTLHGGFKGLDSVVWDVREVTDTSLTLHYLHADGEGGFPGNLDITMTYTLCPEGIWRIDYQASTDKTTPVNISNHPFFNLAGKGDCLDWILCVNADEFIATDGPQVIEQPVKVEGTAMDYRIPHKVRDAVESSCPHILNANKGFDHNYCIRGKGFRQAASLYCPENGIFLQVYSDQPGLQLYSGQWLGGKDRGKRGEKLERYASFTFETQNYPDAPNKPSFPDPFLKPGEKYTHRCEYRFSVQSPSASEGLGFISQEGGPVLGYSLNSGVEILRKDGLFFKDLNRNGAVDEYEDWRLSSEERAADLASRMSDEEIAGLMLYSTHQKVLTSGLTPAQREFMSLNNVRHILVTKVASPETAARWNNNVQAFAENLPLGIPANNSSDPRHGTVSDAEYNAGGGGEISMWPGSLGLAATFDPALVHRFGEIMADEYRAMGLTTALSPQIDLSTEPRWRRVSGTFGESPVLATEMARAYIDAIQTSDRNERTEGAWGYGSVNAMVKHWPGGCTGEGGRDAHYGFGKYAVYPGNNFRLHKKPFIEGAFNLVEGTSEASAVMPYYTISYNQTDENVGNGFNYDIIQKQLRDSLNYDGVVCTDWGIVNPCVHPGVFGGKPWGLEELSPAELHLRVLKAGVDQFGDVNSPDHLLEAFSMLEEEVGRKAMRDRIEASARRLLRNIFRTGLFENPYLDVEKSVKVIGNSEYMKEGFDAQLRSIVLLKNRAGVLPLNDRNLKVYVPDRHIPAHMGLWGYPEEEKNFAPVSAACLDAHFTPAATPEEADVAIVFIDGPESGKGYDTEDLKNGGNGYVPLSLQYSPYTAETAREHSIAGGDPKEDFMNRSYRGKTVRCWNETELETVKELRKRLGTKPLIVCMNLQRPAVMSEIEPLADALIVTFDVQNQAVMDIVSGAAEPSARLPVQLPADMETVERQFEDTPFDMVPYRDSEGNVYDFGFGLDFKGKIKTDDIRKYGKPDSYEN